MSKRTIAILLLTVAWFWFCHYRYTCIHKQVCYGCAPDQSQSISPLIIGPLTFNSNDTRLLVNDDFKAAKDSILSGKSADNIFEVVGYYYSDEKPPEGFENMGLARATKAKDLFKDDIPTESIRLIGKEIKGNAPTSQFDAVDFNWKVIDVAKSEVVETEGGDRAEIYFPSNSAQKEVDPKIDAYLKQVAERVILSKESISLIGHTDNVGSPSDNQKLGMQRANSIRDVLKYYGVPAKQLNTTSKGETEPFTTNETIEGRHQNRRVVLSIRDKKPN